MPFNTKGLVRAIGSIVAPQYFNPTADEYEVQQGANGASFVQVTGSSVVDVTLQNAASAVANGTALAVGGVKTLTLEISGTSASRTIIFEGASVSGTYYPVMGTKLSDLTTATQTTGTGEVWQFDVTGLVNFRARISAVAGGNVSVRGKAVA